MTWGQVAVLVATSRVYMLERPLQRNNRRKAPSHGVSTTNFDLTKTNPAELKGGAWARDGHSWILPWTSQPFYEHHAKQTFLCLHRGSSTSLNNEAVGTLTRMLEG